MKKLKTVLILVVVIVLAYFTFQLLSQKSSSLSDEALSDFAVKDTALVDRINIYDTQGNEVFFVRDTDKKWTQEGGACVQQHMIHVLLETFKYIAVKSPVPEGAVDHVNKRIAVNHKKVEIFQEGKLVKTWFVGNATQDRYGTYMLLSEPDKGKSPEPFIMYMPNMYGSLETRFSTNPLDYFCSEIFLYDPLNIKQVNVKIPDSTVLNYSIKTIDKNTFELYNNENKITEFDTAKVRLYLTFFQKVHFEYHNRTYTPQQVDSLRKSKPYYVVEVIDKNDKKNRVATYLKEPAFDRYDFDGNLIPYDLDRMWAFTNDGQLVVVQFFVFDKLLRDVNYFLKPKS